MLKNYDESVELNHNPNWSYVPDHPYRILIIIGPGSSKINVLWNLIQKLDNQILAKFIYKSKIHSNQSISYLLRDCLHIMSVA